MVDVKVQPAYILYTKPFRETSLLLEIFSRDYGRLSLIGRGIRGAFKQSFSKRGCRPRFSGLLQPFVPLLLSWRGRTNLLNLTAAESTESPLLLNGKSLCYAWYLNELLFHLIRPSDAYPEVFEAYQIALSDLSNHPYFSLRQFERSLLMSLGTIPQLDRETHTGRSVNPDYWYEVSPEKGVLISQMPTHEIKHFRFRGSFLLAVQQDSWREKEYLTDIKKLFRIMLDDVLGGVTIRAKDLLKFHKPLS